MSAVLATPLMNPCLSFAASEARFSALPSLVVAATTAVCVAARNPRALRRPTHAHEAEGTVTHLKALRTSFGALGCRENARPCLVRCVPESAFLFEHRASLNWFASIFAVAEFRQREASHRATPPGSRPVDRASHLFGIDMAAVARNTAPVSSLSNVRILRCGF